MGGVRRLDFDKFRCACEVVRSELASFVHLLCKRLKLSRERCSVTTEFRCEPDQPIPLAPSNDRIKRTVNTVSYQIAFAAIDVLHCRIDTATSHPRMFRVCCRTGAETASS